MEPSQQRENNFWSLLRRTPPMVLPMLVLSIGFVIAGQIAVKGVRSANDTLTVTGASTEQIISDYADWNIEVTGTGSSQQLAYRDLQPTLQQSLDFLKNQGIKDDELSLEVLNLSSRENRNRVTSQLISTTWFARQVIRIASEDVNKISDVSNRISELVGQGVPLTIRPPAYTYTKLAEKRVDMLAKATADARKRALAIAREAGSGIGAITNADTGTFQITVPNSTEMSNFGSYNTSTIQKDITAVMGVTFRVK